MDEPCPCIFIPFSVFGSHPLCRYYFPKAKQSGSRGLLRVSCYLHIQYLCYDTLVSLRSVAKILFASAWRGCHLWGVLGSKKLPAQLNCKAKQAANLHLKPTKPKSHTYLFKPQTAHVLFFSFFF